MRRTLFLSLWLLASGASAQTITGTENVPFDHGTVIDIGGTGFGAKATAAPLGWDDFEGASNGDLVSVIDGWGVTSDNTASLWPQISTTRARAGSNSVVIIHPAAPTTPLRDIAYYAGLDIGPGEKFFWSFWLWNEWEGPLSQGAANTQHKYSRLVDGVSQNDTKPEVVLTWNTNGAPYWFAADENGNFTLCDADQTINTNISVGSWKNYTLIGQLGTYGGGCDGYLETWYDGSLQRTTEGIGWFALSDGSKFNQVWLGEYGKGFSEEVRFYYDDNYIDDSWARVELGDSPIYANCTVREMQIPTVWTATQISITVNTGSFGSGDSAWLYVIDENNNRSNGYPVTIGQSGGGISPVALTAPTNLQVNGGN